MQRSTEWHLLLSDEYQPIRAGNTFSTEMIRLNVSSRRNYSVDDLFDRLIIESDVNDVKERQFLMTERRSETCITVRSMQPTLEILSLVLTCHPVTLWSPLHTAN